MGEPGPVGERRAFDDGIMGLFQFAGGPLEELYSQIGVVAK